MLKQFLRKYFFLFFNFPRKKIVGLEWQLLSFHQILFLFFLLFPSGWRFWPDQQKFFPIFHSLLLLVHVTSTGHDMPCTVMLCALEVKVQVKSHGPSITWSFEVTWNTKKIIHYHSSSDYQTLQDDNLPCWIPAHKATWPLNHVVFQDHVTS